MKEDDGGERSPKPHVTATQVPLTRVGSVQVPIAMRGNERHHAIRDGLLDRSPNGATPGLCRYCSRASRQLSQGRCHLRWNRHKG